MRAVLALVSFSTLAIATPSDACRVARSPEEKLKDGYSTGAISGVALVTIKSTKFVREPYGDAHPWAAAATIDQVVRGSYEAKTVSFVRGWGSTACDEGYAPPTPGDRWIVYFRKRPQGEQVVWASYPLRVASTSDPTLLSLQIGDDR